jgi:hypothetical protein
MKSGEAGNKSGTMPPDTLNQIRRYANIQNAVPFAGKNVGTRLSQSHVTNLEQDLLRSKSSSNPHTRRLGESRDPTTSYKIASSPIMST